MGWVGVEGRERFTCYQTALPLPNIFPIIHEVQEPVESIRPLRVGDVHEGADEGADAAHHYDGADPPWQAWRQWLR